MSISLSFYHRMPTSTRSIAASLRGYYLRWWRYDKDTERLVEEALERDYWSQQEWEEWRQNRLSFILHRAATKVPYYREMWSRRRQNGDRASYEYLENWPILEKQTLREVARAFVADDCDPKRMFLEHTSGTTGTSLDLWSSRETLKYWYALSEARWRRWYGVSKEDRWAILGGQLVTPVNQERPPFWVWNSGLKQLYMSSYHLAAANLRSYLQAMKERRVRYVVGYTSALYSLAHFALNEKIEDIRFEVVITNAEPLYEYQREVISEAFRCPVRETYGMAEMAAAASECSSGSLHQWPEAGLIETPSTAITDVNGVGDLISTGLVNPDMLLIRYRIGDSGRHSGESCECGRSLPLIAKIEGRNDDLLYTIDGRRIGRLDPVFKGTFEISEAQIVQRSLRLILVRYVPNGTASKELETKIADRIRERMGDVTVEFELVSVIPRTARAKFRAVICELSNEEKAGLAASHTA
ncbi:MAG: hypothetical protein AB7V18_07300 [Pyrinomonadaceae bacterium]